MKKLITLAFVLLMMGGTFAQNVKYVNSSSPVKEKTVVETKVLGAIEDNVYMYTTDYARKTMRLSIYNKENTELKKTLPVVGFGAKKTYKILKLARLKTVLLKNDNIFVVWEIENNKESTLFLQLFDKDFQELQQPRSIYRLTNKNKAVHKAELFFLMSPSGNKIIVGGEESSVKSENVKLQYKVMDVNQEVLNTVQAELPYSLSRKGYGATSEYQVDNSGILFFDTDVNVIDEDNKRAQAVKTHLFGNINPETSEVKSKSISFENKDIQNFSYELFDDHVFVFGTFSTKYNKKNKKAEINHGIYSLKIDKQSFEAIGDIQFDELDETKVVYSNFVMSSSKKKKYTKEEYSLNQMTNFGLIITDFKKTEDNGIIMSLNSQLFRTVCSNKGGGCRYYTDLYGVSFIKLNTEGEIEWISCTEQKITYAGFVVPQNKLAKNGNNYHSVVQSRPKLMTSYLIDNTTGMVKETTIKNKFKDEKAEVINDEMYFVGRNWKLSTSGWAGMGFSALMIPASLVALPAEFVAVGVLGAFGVAYISYSFKRNDVYFGKYEVQ